MTGRLFSFFLVFYLASVPVFATNITAQTGSGDSASGQIAQLRDMAETLLRESRGGPTLSEGEELVVRPGSGRSLPPDTEAMRAGLSRIGEAVNLDELPALVRQLSRSQADATRLVQVNLQNLARSGSVSGPELSQLLINIERQTASIVADQLVLQGMQQKVNSVLSDPGLPAAQKAMLNQYTKLLLDAMGGIQNNQNELIKMGRSGRTLQPAPGESAKEEMKKAADMTASVWGAVDSLKREAEGNPSGLSQEFFLRATDKLNDAVKNISELTQRVQEILNTDPTNQLALALLKQLSDYQTRAATMMKDFAVVKVDAAVLVEAQEVKDQLGDAVTVLKRRLEALKARDKEAVSKEEIEALFSEYDSVAALAEKGKKLGEAALRAGAGTKYETAEQAEMRKLLAGITAEFGSLGADGEGLAPGARESVWAEYFKEKEEAADEQENGPALELVNDLNSGTLAAVPTVAARLAGAVVGGVLKKDSAYYGAALMNIGPSSIVEGLAADYASLKQADLVVFKVENGRYSSVNLGSFQVYDGAAHAALAVNGSGELAVFLNNTLAGDRTMSGAFFTLDPATLAQLSSYTLDLPPDSGWFPRLDAAGALLSLYTDNLDEYQCADAACDLVTPLVPGAFAAGTEALRAWQSRGAYSRDDYSGDLPTAVLAGRLSGETEAEQLGNYSYLSWGRWNDGAGVADTIHTNSYWLAGTLTPANEVPTVGGASYTGQLFGKVTEAGAISAVTGTTSLSADFAGRTMTGTFDMNKNGAAWTMAAVNAAWGAGSNSFSGSLTADNNLKGAVSGGFFGPAAAQVGGAWNLGNNSDVRAAGVFTAEQPVAQ